MSGKRSLLRSLEQPEWDRVDATSGGLHESMKGLGSMKIKKSLSVLFVSMVLLAAFTKIDAQETKLKWFGHAAFSITTPNGKVLLVDPWLRNPSNPEAANGKDPLVAISKVDYILLTH